MRLLLLGILFLCLSSNAYSRIYLVSVGISDYPGTNGDLDLPVNDAKHITWIYEQNKNVDSRQLLNSQATVNNILSALRSQFSKAQTGDIIVFYFSGHGYQGGFCAYDGSLSYEKIRSEFSRSKATGKMIFADACYSGDIATDGRQHSYKDDDKKAGVMLFLSSRSTEVSRENPTNMKNGYFTEYLAKGLRGSADANRDRIITARELYNYVHREVKKATNDKQHPVMWGNFSDNMKVIQW